MIARLHWVYAAPWCYEGKYSTPEVRWTNVPLSMVLQEWRLKWKRPTRTLVSFSFIKAVFKQYVNDFCRCVYMFSWISWTRVGLPGEAPCQNYRNQQLSQSYHWLWIVPRVFRTDSTDVMVDCRAKFNKWPKQCTYTARGEHSFIRPLSPSYLHQSCCLHRQSLHSRFSRAPTAACWWLLWLVCKEFHQLLFSSHEIQLINLTYCHSLYTSDKMTIARLGLYRTFHQL